LACGLNHRTVVRTHLTVVLSLCDCFRTLMLLVSDTVFSLNGFIVSIYQCKNFCVSGRIQIKFLIVHFYLLSIHNGTLLHSKSQYTTVKHSRQLLEHTYASDPHGLRTLTPIVFFQQYLLWQSSNTHSHSCSHKAFKHMSGQSIVRLSVHLHTTTALRRIVHH
jgi:hypothetical protein